MIIKFASQQCSRAHLHILKHSNSVRFSFSVRLCTFAEYRHREQESENYQGEYFLAVVAALMQARIQEIVKLRLKRRAELPLAHGHVVLAGGALKIASDLCYCSLLRSGEWKDTKRRQRDGYQSEYCGNRESRVSN